MTENILEVRDLRAGYGSDPDILQGVNLNVARGTSCCIIGPNGAGKSTVLKAIAGTLKTRGGQVMFDGAPLSGSRTVLCDPGSTVVRFHDGSREPENGGVHTQKPGRSRAEDRRRL